MASSNTFAAMKWTNDGNRLSHLHLKYITEPKKSFADYEVGDTGTARYPGFPGQWTFQILALGESRQEAVEWINEYLNDLETSTTPVTNKRRKTEEQVKQGKRLKAVTKNKTNEDRIKQVQTDEAHRLRMAKTMPFALTFNRDRDDNNTQTPNNKQLNTSNDSDFSDDILIPEIHRQKTFNKDRDDNNTQTPNNKQLNTSNDSGFSDDILIPEIHRQKTFNRDRDNNTQTPNNKQLNTSNDSDFSDDILIPEIHRQKTFNRDRDDNNTQTPNNKQLNTSNDSDSSDVILIPEIHRQKDECLSADCPWKRRYMQLKKETTEEKTVDKPGIFTNIEEAKRNHMVELVPGTCVCVPNKTYELVFSLSNTRREIATKLFRCFFSTSQMEEAGKIKHLPRGEKIVDAILTCALRVKRDLPPVEYSALKKALVNVMTYTKRDKDTMRDKQRRKCKFQKENKRSFLTDQN